MTKEIQLSDYSQYMRLSNALFQKAKETLPYFADYLVKSYPSIFHMVELREYSLVFRSGYHLYQFSVLIEPEYLIRKKRAQFVTHKISQTQSSSTDNLVEILELTFDFDELNNFWPPANRESGFGVGYIDFLASYVPLFIGLWLKHGGPITSFDIEKSLEPVKKD